MKDLVERVIRIQNDAEAIMKDASRILSEEIGTKVLAIRYWGVQVSDEDWVLNQPDSVVTRRPFDADIPYEVTAEINGIRFFSITADEKYAELVQEETA